MSAPRSTPAETAQRLLQTILTPDSLEKGCPDPTIPGEVCGPCLQLEAINTKLSAHLEELNKLLLIRMEVKERLNQHHDPFARHLPVEITSHIFAIYIEIFNSDFDLQNPIIKHGGPLLLGAVSKSWREIAFSMPNLWNTVNILIPSTNHLPTKVELIHRGQDPGHLKSSALDACTAHLVRHLNSGPFLPAGRHGNRL